MEVAQKVSRTSLPLISQSSHHVNDITIMTSGHGSDIPFALSLFMTSQRA